jgi:hypothetical protein
MLRVLARDARWPRRGLRPLRPRAPLIPALLALVTFASASACSGAHDVRARYPEPPAPGEARAGLELRFTGSMSNVYVAVNGRLVCAGEHTDRILVTDLPPGNTQVIVAADGEPAEKAFAIDLPAGRVTVVPLAAPPSSNGGGFLVQALVSALVYGAYLALRSAL